MENIINPQKKIIGIKNTSLSWFALTALYTKNSTYKFNNGKTSIKILYEQK